jgi:hypothetical protein
MNEPHSPRDVANGSTGSSRGEPLMMYREAYHPAPTLPMRNQTMHGLGLATSLMDRD